MADPNRIIDEAASIFALVREYMKTNPSIRPEGPGVHTRTSQSVERHGYLHDDIRQEIERWEKLVREARSSGSLPPSAADEARAAEILRSGGNLMTGQPEQESPQQTARDVTRGDISRGDPY